MIAVEGVVVVVVEVEMATTSAEDINQSSRDLLRVGSNDFVILEN